MSTIRSQAANPVVQEQPVVKNRGRSRETSESSSGSGGRRSNEGNGERHNRNSSPPPPAPQPPAPQPTPSQFEEAAQTPVKPHEAISNNSSDPNFNDGNTDITYQQGHMTMDRWEIMTEKKHLLRTSMTMNNQLKQILH